MRTVTQKELAELVGMSVQDAGLALCKVKVQYTIGAKHYAYEEAKEAVVQYVETKSKKFRDKSDKWDRILERAKTL